MSKKLICILGIHDYRIASIKQSDTFHAVFNPLYIKTIKCKHCPKEKTIRYEHPAF